MGRSQGAKGPRILRRPDCAMTFGALARGALTAAYFMAQIGLASPVEGHVATSHIQALLFWGLFSFILATAAFSIGLLLVGLPAWLLLRRCGLEGPGWAVAAGFVLSPTPGLFLKLQAGARPVLSTDHLLLALAGGVVGWVIWRVAYRTER